MKYKKKFILALLGKRIWKIIWANRINWKSCKASAKKSITQNDDQNFTKCRYCLIDVWYQECMNYIQYLMQKYILYYRQLFSIHSWYILILFKKYQEISNFLPLASSLSLCNSKVLKKLWLIFLLLMFFFGSSKTYAHRFSAN